ncbi:crossover junction endonuclease EME1B-like isoform X2 [Mercurialis annua]|uniref:crossover junction endonuclease EME1B-like isoform X2 n=1 Tax=Mercurialis annua TaxID=3986 RepID=UPI00215F394B|nr:crossover junction endonuclease EME1B-like isoform X2 [Mercurialis annua]
MSNPIVLSDDEEEAQNTPIHSLSKKPRTTTTTAANLNFISSTAAAAAAATNTIFLIDDDPTPQKNNNSSGPTSTATATSSSFSIVPDTPMSDDISIVKCTFASRFSNFQSNLDESRFVCLETENDEPGSGSPMENWKAGEKIVGDISDGDETEKTRWSSRFYDSLGSLGNDNLTQPSGDNSPPSFMWQDDTNQINDDTDKENCNMEHISNNIKQKVTNVSSDTNKVRGNKKLTKEERIRLIEERKQKKEEEKLQKAALKAQGAEMKKLEKEKQKWEKGKLASKSIVAALDTKVVEQGSIGGHLLTRFSEKGLTYRLTSNSIEKSIVWTMSVPEHISQLCPKGTEIQYVLLVYEAEEFCKLVMDGSLFDHVSRVQSRYPSYTVCYLTNRLMAYINKREKEQYKNPENANGWRCPPIEEILAKLTTHFVRVHYRHCRDEAEIAEHVIGLTSSLASCQFRDKLTRLSVNANGSLIPKDSIDKNLIKKSTWLKALVAIPKVQPRFAVAIWKKYPTMKSLLRVYMDPSKSIRIYIITFVTNCLDIPKLQAFTHVAAWKL